MGHGKSGKSSQKLSNNLFSNGKVCRPCYFHRLTLPSSPLPLFLAILNSCQKININPSLLSSLASLAFRFLSRQHSSLILLIFRWHKQVYIVLLTWWNYSESGEIYIIRYFSLGEKPFVSCLVLRRSFWLFMSPPTGAHRIIAFNVRHSFTELWDDSTALSLDCMKVSCSQIVRKYTSIPSNYS